MHSSLQALVIETKEQRYGNAAAKQAAFYSREDVEGFKRACVERLQLRELPVHPDRSFHHENFQDSDAVRSCEHKMSAWLWSDCVDTRTNIPRPAEIVQAGRREPDTTDYSVWKWEGVRSRKSWQWGQDP